MHDIDRTWSEYGSGETESGERGFEFGQEADFSGEASSPFSEEQEMELAAELLSLGNPAELEYFLGNLIKKAGNAVGSFVSSPVGQALGGILKQAAKQAAKQALPVVGSAIGGYVGGSKGANIGGKVASAAGNLLGLELEGMSQEDMEFEFARKFVKFAGATVSKALQGMGIDPNTAAKRAALSAAQRFLPGLVGELSGQGNGNNGNGRTGRWYRRGNKIVLVGL